MGDYSYFIFENGKNSLYRAAHNLSTFSNRKEIESILIGAFHTFLT